MNIPLQNWIPLLKALEGYKRETFRGDLVAGLTTAVMLIPQGMGYALLAGLPPIYGLYSALVPIAIYAVFGSSRQLAVGPVAMVSLLVATSVGQLVPPGTPEFVPLAILLAGLVGLLQVAMGLARVGFLVNFLSHPVISGFTSAAALIIGFGQFKHLFGLSLARSSSVFEIATQVLSQLDRIHLPTLALGAGSVTLLVTLKRFAPAWPRALVLVVLSIGTTWGLSLDTAGVTILGAVPGGLPPLALPEFDVTTVRQLLPMALAIALVGFMESIAVAKRYARENRYTIEPNQELIGLGLANLVGSLFAAMPTTGGFARSAVNAQAGARSGVAGLVTASSIAIALLFLTPLFHYLPTAALAAIIVTAVVGLVDLHEVKHLWKVKRSDLAMLAITFLATLSLGIEEGIVIGVGASIALLLFRTTRPHTAVLGCLPGTTTYRNVDRYPQAITQPGTMIVRPDAQFYFGNVTYLQDKLVELERLQPVPLERVVLDASGVNQLDASAETALQDIVLSYQRRNVEFVLAAVKGPVRDVLDRSGLATLLGPAGIALCVHDAVLSPRAAATSLDRETHSPSA